MLILSCTKVLQAVQAGRFLRFFYGHLIQPFMFAEYQSDLEFNSELEQYQKRTGKALDEPVWHVSVSSGDWRNAKTFLPQSSVQKIIDLETQLVSARKRIRLPEGVQVLSEDEWDLKFGWAACTGLLPSQVFKLERYAARYLNKLETNSINIEAARVVFLIDLFQAGLLNREFETDAVYHQLKELGCHNLKLCLDSAKYLYGYQNSQIRSKHHLPQVLDIRNSSFVLDWMFQTIKNPGFGSVLTYKFMSELEVYFLSVKPQTLEPLDFSGWQVFLVKDGKKIKLSHVGETS